LSRDAESGFTLFEALIALAVMAAGLAAIGKLGFTTVSAARRVETRFFLTAAARKAFAALPDRAALADGRMEGAIDGAAFRLEASPYAFAVPDAPGGARWAPEALRLAVADPSGARIVVDTVRLRPSGAAR
jgi:hypothetical protein